MKIDLIITELDVGGAELCLTNLALFLQARRHTIRIIALGDPPAPDRAMLLEKVRSANIPIHFLNASRSWHFPQAAMKLSSLVKKTPPDIAQSFLYHANVMAACVYPSKGIRLVGGVRVADPSRIRSMIHSYASKQMEHLVCVSESVAKTIEVRELIPRSKLSVIPNGIAYGRHDSQPESDDSNRQIPIKPPTNVHSAQRQLGLDLSTPCLLFVGRLDYQKGVDSLAEHWDEILAGLPEHHLIFVGDGPLKSPLQSRASQSRYEDRIHFAGRRNDVFEWMNSSDLLVLPTRYEGMPNVILEAMSCGLPVASMRAEGVVELLGSHFEEQTTDIDDWPAFVELVVQIASNPELKRVLGHSNRLRCIKDFDLESQLSKYESLYEAILSKDGMQSPPAKEAS